MHSPLPSYRSSKMPVELFSLPLWCFSGTVYLVGFGCTEIPVCKGRLAATPPAVHKLIHVSGEPACHIRNSSYRWKITQVQVVLTCLTPDIRFLGKDPEESGNCGIWWIISDLACVFHTAYLCQSVLLLTAGGLWKCSSPLAAFTIPALLIGWCKWVWHMQMFVICPKVTKSWSTVCSVLSSKDAKNNHTCLLRAKDLVKLQPLHSFGVCRQWCTQKNSLPWAIVKRQI